MQFAPLYPPLYRLLSTLFPRCLWQGDPQQPAIALTFDDGPHPQFTPALLERLDHWGVTASFFWLGVCVERYPAIARAVMARGHTIGLHGYTHRNFPQLRAAELQASLAKTQAAIAIACDRPLSDIQRTVRNVRPPNGLFLPSTLTHLESWGYQPVMWSVVPEDWANPGVEVICRRIYRQTQNGSLIVLHDGPYGGPTVAAVVDQIVPRLQDAGLHFVSVDQLGRLSSALAR